MSFKVSVIIPCYNCSKWIIRCLDSIPSRDDIEIICVNDGSSDNTEDILNNYNGSRWAKFSVISQENQGPGKSRDVGIEAAEGIYICLIDADDYIFPEVFNDVVDTYLVGDIIKPRHETDSLEIYWPRIMRGAFIKSSLAKRFKHPHDRMIGEDTEYRKEIEKINPRILYLNEVMYHYFNFNLDSVSHKLKKTPKSEPKKNTNSNKRVKVKPKNNDYFDGFNQNMVQNEFVRFK